ncbi:MAG: AAA family ATPase [Vulcanisaeta sp.]|uniref:Adenylate kinase, conjectural n=1 Tax=Vulcanisaeta moutnovskia (strain 768-28) TaxID=985053 RepID=F0QSL4_VULM7|nr:AAA family ATPase [Vulcanisaeta moutnovskia]ADY01531.1 adenylate kinase, conjectural [Vulcanisaeta moutnovskia 768-28]
MIVIVITGLPGSGKTIASDVARELGLPVVIMGDIIREEAMRSGIPSSMASVTLRLRGGTRYIAHKTLEKAPRSLSIVVIDGARSIREIETIEETLSTKVILIYVVAPWRLRFERLLKRGRPDDPRTIEDFLMRDLRELKYGLGDLIARADYILVNDSSVEEFKEKTRRILTSIMQVSR